MSEPSTPSFQGMCHFIGQLSKASKTGMRAALADCPKCHFNMLEGLLHAINCHGKDGAIYVSDLPGRSDSRCRRSRAGCGSWSRTALWCGNRTPPTAAKRWCASPPRGTSCAPV